MAFTYNDTLADAISRVRSRVGDIVSPGLLPDATYAGAMTRALLGGKAFTVVAAGDLFTISAHGLLNGDGVVLSALSGATGVTALTLYYVRDASTDTFKLAAAPGGAAIDITVDGSGTIATVNEPIAARGMAAILAAYYATKPDSISSDGSSLTWRERIDQWNTIALGESGGSVPPPKPASSRVGKIKAGEDYQVR